MGADDEARAILERTRRVLETDLRAITAFHLHARRYVFADWWAAQWYDVKFMPDEVLNVTALDLAALVEREAIDLEVEGAA